MIIDEAPHSKSFAGENPIRRCQSRRIHSQERYVQVKKLIEL